MSNDFGKPSRDDDSLQLGEIFAILLRQKLLVLGVAAATTLGVLLWIGTRTPVYQAKAILLLEQDEAAGGVLSELASLTADPKAEAEIALIQSRSLAAVTAAAPRDPGPIDAVFVGTTPDFDPFASEAGAAADPSAMDQLGLNCVVERHDLRPMRSLIARLAGEKLSSHRLRAGLEPLPDADERAQALDVEFVKKPQAGSVVRVLISPHEGFVGADNDDAVEFEFQQGAPVEAFGWQLRLWPAGDFIGQRYTVSYLTEAQAITRLMESVTAEESGRKTNVVAVNVTDNDPDRAAETANALAKNYIRRSVSIGQQKATRTVRFIEQQLEEQLTALSKAEAEVVRLQTLHPETISISVSASTLIEQSGTLELQIAELRLAQQGLREALVLLEGGDLGSLARLGQNMPNLQAIGYLEELGRLDAESLRLDRTDVVGYKALLLAERIRLTGIADEGELRAQALSSAMAAMERGETAAVARLGADPDFGGYLTELASVDAELSRLRGSAKGDNPLVRAAEGNRQALLNQIKSQVTGALAGTRARVNSYRSLAKTYEENLTAWPEEERSTIAAARDSLVNSVGENLRSQLKGIESNIAALDGQVLEVERRLGALPGSELLLAEPMRQRVARTHIVEFLLSSQQEAGITAAATSAAAVLIDPATPPPSRIFPRTTLIMLFGAVAGLLLGCGCALVHNRLRAALHTESEVERVTELPVLGSVPNFMVGKTRVPEAKGNPRFVPLFDKPEGPQSEAYRQIRASLRLALPADKPLRTLAATSCVPGEGKTVTNVDLALAFAETGKKVLLVDGDLRKPRIHDVFLIDRGPGFAEALEGTGDWRRHVLHNLMGCIDVLPAGHCKGRPGEVLASPAVGPILEELTAEYDMVVFDLPPAVVVADVANFAGRLDALVLLYRCGGVPGRLLQGAAGRLRRAGVHLAGVVLNAVIARTGPGGYGYGYGYGYGNTYGYGETQEQTRKVS